MKKRSFFKCLWVLITAVFLMGTWSAQAGEFHKAPRDFRITSYNVCYTKLLRTAGCFIVAILTHGGAHRMPRDRQP